MEYFHILNKGQPYPSEHASVEQEKVQNQLAIISAKLNEMNSRKEPVYAFRVTSVKDSGTLKEQYVSKNPGKIINLNPNIIISNKCNGGRLR